MNKAKFTFKNRFLFIGYLFAFFIINELIFGSVIVNGGMVYETVEVEIIVDVTKDYGEAHQNEIVIEPMNENNPMPGDNQKNQSLKLRTIRAVHLKYHLMSQENTNIKFTRKLVQMIALNMMKKCITQQ